jgi:HTH-type transcriptional regulator/antitoxin HigA
MGKRTADAVEILRARLIGDDEHRQALLREERLAAAVAGLIYDARKHAGLNQKQLAEKIGTTQSVISRLEDADYGRHSLRMLQRIADALGQKLEVRFVGDEIETTSSVAPSADVDWLVDNCPAREMAKRDWIPQWNTAQEMRRNLFAFFGPAPRLAGAVRLRGTRAKDADNAALTAWLTKLETAADDVDVPKLSPRRLREALPELPRLSVCQDGPVRAVEWLERRGVPCVFVRHLPKTYVDGAAFVRDDGRPSIGLSLRHDRLDNFWFTLLHELAHVLLHRGDVAIQPIVDQEIERQSDDACEDEANAFAQGSWVQDSAWRDFRRTTHDRPRLADISAFASDLGVSAALVAGRLRFELHRWTHYKGFLHQGSVAKLLSKQYPIF